MSKNKSFEVEATLRHNVGKGASRRLRREEKVPCVVYGGGEAAATLALDHDKIARALEKEAFYSRVLTLKTGENSERVILKDVQRHAYKPRIVHIDFQRVRADEKLHMHVPIHFLNADKSPGVKAGGLVSHIMSDIEISCLPDDLPEFLELDISEMDINDAKHMSDIKLPKGVEITQLTEENDQAVVSIHMPRAEEEIPTEAPVATEVPAIAQKSEAEIAAEKEQKKEEKK